MNRRRFLNKHIESTLSTGEFWRYVVSYILVLLIPVALGSFVYARSVRVVSDEAIRLNSSLLAQTQATIDGRVNEIQNVARSLAADPAIGRVALADQPVSGPAPYYMLEVWDQVVSFAATNSFVESVQVHFRRSGAVVSPKLSAVELDRFYGELFRYGGLSQEEFVRRFLHAPGGGSFHPVGTIDTPDGNSRVIVYSQSFPVGSMGRPSGTILVMLPVAEVEALLRNLFTGQGGFAFVQLEDGTRLLELGAPQIDDVFTERRPPDGSSGSFVRVVDGDPMVVAYTVSANTGWRYVAGVPRSLVLERVAYIRRITLIVGWIIGIVGIIVAIVFAYRNVIPLARVVHAIGGALSGSGEDSGTAFDYIESTLLRLRDRNTRLQETIARQRPFVRSSFFDRLVKGEFAVPEQIERVREFMDLEMPDGSYVVLIVDHGEYRGMVDSPILEELETKQALLRTWLEGAGYEHLWLHTVEEDTSVLIFACPAAEGDAQRLDPEDPCARRLHGLVTDLSSRLSADELPGVRIAVGQVYHELIDVSRSYGEAMAALSWARVHADSRRVMWYRDIAFLEAETYYLPIEYQERLLHTVTAGRSDQSKAMLDELREVNFHERNLSPRMLGQFVDDMRGIAVRVSSIVAQRGYAGVKPPMDELLDELDRRQDPAAVYDRVRGYLLAAAFAIDQSHRSHNGVLRDRLVAHIEANYQDPQLSLQSIADSFGLNETYVSRFYKEQTGESLSHAVERRRMNAAFELLTTGEETVDEIANAIGYNSSNAFRRAFKRITGLSPAAYREAHTPSP